MYLPIGMEPQILMKLLNIQKNLIHVKIIFKIWNIKYLNNVNVLLEVLLIQFMKCHI